MVDLVENGNGNGSSNSGTAIKRFDASLSQQQGTALTVYDKVDPMDFIDKMGKVFAMSAAGGCKSENEGKLMALACLCERKTIFEISRRYHLMSGKLVLKAETMLGDFRKAGGKHKWLADGSDGKAASLELVDRDGNKIVSSFTIEKAKAAGYVKDGSNWQKRPDQQLRARCITDGVRMLCPEISSGEVAEEEVDDFPVMQSAQQTTTTAAPIRSAAEVQKRREELQAASGNSTAGNVSANGNANVSKATTSTTPAATSDDQVIDVKSEPAQTAETATTATTTTASVTPTETAPFDADGRIVGQPLPGEPNHDAHTQVLMEIELTVSKAGLTVETVINAVNNKNGTAYKSLDDIPEESALTLLENLRNIIQKEAEQAARQANQAS